MQAEGVAGTKAVPVGSDALAEGLMLVRASTLKVIRLQLAMERRDRRVALEAVDDLVELDRRLGNYMADMPALFGQERQRDELDREAAELQREKLTLAAEVIRRPEPSATVVSFPAPEPAETAPEAYEEAPWTEEDEPRCRPVLKWAIAGLAFAAAVAAGAAFIPGSPELFATAMEMVR
jgi:hypothetical protein